MNYIRIIMIAAIVAIAPLTQLQAQPVVETITVDTLCYLGKDEPGKSGGALFLPDGNIIALWWGRPLIIDSKTGTIIRNLDSCASESVSEPRLSPDGAKFVATKMGPTFVIWDVPTGKIIKEMNNVNDYRFSHDGSKLYICGGNSSGLGAVRVLDANTFEEIERFGTVESGWRMDITPDESFIVMATYKKPDNEYDKMTNQVILIDLKDKTKYTVLETFVPQVYSMEFSPDGKTFAFHYNNGNVINIYIYNIVTKEKKTISKQELSTMFGNMNIAAIGIPMFMDYSIIYTGIGDYSGYVEYSFTWNILENRIKNYIKFPSATSIDVNDSLIILCTSDGMIGQIEKKTVPVKDLAIPNESYLNYHNNQLEYISDKSLICETSIYDTTGKLIINLGQLPFFMGKNIINVNRSLSIGVYIITIKDQTSQSSYKFIVE